MCGTHKKQLRARFPYLWMYFVHPLTPTHLKHDHTFIICCWMINKTGTTSSIILQTQLSTKDQIYIYTHTHTLTHSMQQGPSWEANQFSASQEIPHILWNLNVHHHGYKSPPHAPILSQIKPVHALQFNFLKIHFNINLTSTSGLSKWSLNLSLPTKTLYAPLLCLICATCFPTI